MSENMSHDAWVMLVSKTLDDMLQYRYVDWHARMTLQSIVAGSTVVLAPEESVGPLRSVDPVLGMKRLS